MSRQRAADRAIVHEMFQSTDFGSAIIVLVFGADGQSVFSTNATNPCAPSAMKLSRVGIHAACGAINSAGDWTLRLRVNESLSDSATISFPIATLPGSKTAGQMSSAAIILQAGDTYYIQADGPSRNIILARAIIQWEIL